MKKHVFKIIRRRFILRVSVVPKDEFLGFSIYAAALVGGVPLKGAPIDLALLRIRVRDAEAAAIQGLIIGKGTVLYLGVYRVAAESAAVAVGIAVL